MAIARALINQPKMILADEPTGNLDEANEEIVIAFFRELHSAGHTILMVTHDPEIAQQADRKIELAHGHLAIDPDAYPMDDGIPLSIILLEQIWVCGEEGNRADVRSISSTPGGVDPVRTAMLADGGFASGPRSGSREAQLTDRGKSARARRGPAPSAGRASFQRYFLESTIHEAHTQACKFEHIISPELDERICSFLGHPKTCPHGNPIPPGDCCNHKNKES